MDVAAIEPGRDFRKAIDEHVASCGVLLALIGKNWVDTRDQAGRRRLDDPLDFVHIETAAALKRDIPVVPVLVQGASMPRADELPADLADLAFRNAVELTRARWDSDMTGLIKALSRYVRLRMWAQPIAARFANFALSWIAVIFVMDGTLKNAQGRQDQLDIEKSGRAAFKAPKRPA
jgi:hypothetical protein